MLHLYKKYNLDKEYTSIGLWREIQKKYNPQKVLYPGCYVHITPSLIFEEVVYVDSFRNTNEFYEDSEVKKFIEKNKEYENPAKYRFHHQDYSNALPEKEHSFDAIISQYGGFVGQATKKYLKTGGILICNNSHGDASMASLDADFELIAVYNRKSDEKFSISEANLEEYLIPKKNISVTKDLIAEKMQGVAYTKSPSGYIFQKK